MRNVGDKTRKFNILKVVNMNCYFYSFNRVMCFTTDSVS
jgi:hypothetical protein